MKIDIAVCEACPRHCRQCEYNGICDYAPLRDDLCEVYGIHDL